MDDTPHALVADDNDLICDMVGRALRRMGWRCDCASDGGHALQLSSHRRYQLIVTDLGMPILDGFEFLRGVRDAGMNSTTPVLVVSCRDEDPGEFISKHGVHGYLMKPFGIEELRRAVDEILSAHGPHERPDRGPAC